MNEVRCEGEGATGGYLGGEVEKVGHAWDNVLCLKGQGEGEGG